MGTRPYFVTYQGVRRLVEASSPAVAAQHVVGADIVELRAARASEVSAWYRDQRPVDVAGRVLSDGINVGPVDDVVFTAEDARDWLIEQLGGGPPDARVAFDADGPTAIAVTRLVAAGQLGALGVDDFKLISEICPAFGMALAHGTCDDRAATIENVVAELGDGETIDFQDVVTAIGEAKRRELYEDNVASAQNEQQAAQR